MKKLLITALFLVLIPTACLALSPEEAKTLLAEKGISVSESSLLSNIPIGNIQNIKLLLDAGVNPDSRNQYGWTALMVALSSGQQGVADALVSAGSDINAKSQMGESPIYVAVLSGNTDWVQRLMSLGAKPYEKNKLGMSAYTMAKSLNRTDIMTIMNQPSLPDAVNSPLGNSLPAGYPQITTKTSLIVLDEKALALAKSEAPSLKDINEPNRQFAYWLGQREYGIFTKYAPLRYQLITPYSIVRFAYYKAGRQFKDPDPTLLQDIYRLKNVAWVYLWGTGAYDSAIQLFPAPRIVNVVIRKGGIIYQPLPKEQFTPTSLSSIGVNTNSEFWPLSTSSMWAFPLDLFSQDGDFEIIAIDTEDHQKSLKMSPEDMAKFK